MPIKSRSRESQQKIPVFAHWIIQGLTHPNNRESVISNMTEEYHEILNVSGRLPAIRWCWGELFLSLFSQNRRFLKRHFFHPIYWGGIMFRNYFKTTWRNIQRYKGYSAINIIGLAIGMACCILIFLWVSDELSYDTFHENLDRLYRINIMSDERGAWVSSPWALYPI